VKENYLRWDSLGEFLALAVSFEFLGEKTDNAAAALLGKTLDQATGRVLEENRSPARKVGQIDNRGSHFYLALYWAQALAQQTEDAGRGGAVHRPRERLARDEEKINSELLAVQGSPADIGGYYYVDKAKTDAVMRPSETFNAALASSSHEHSPRAALRLLAARGLRAVRGRGRHQRVTPLLLLYQDRLELSGPATTVVFGVYAAGLAPSLLAAGPLSDRYGRRVLVLPFAVLAGVASLLFAGAQDSFPLLLAARFLQGLVSGAVFTAASAWLAELSAADGERPPPGGARRSRWPAASRSARCAPASRRWAARAPRAAVRRARRPGRGRRRRRARGPRDAARRRRQVGDPARDPLLRKGDRLLAVTALGPVATCVYAFPATIIAGLPLLVALPGSGLVATGVLAGLTSVPAPWSRRCSGGSAPGPLSRAPPAAPPASR
jgi:hypothetical protein